MEIYHDILIGIEREARTDKPAKKTRVQYHSNLSYDKFSRHLKDMESRGLVSINPLSITEKGREFLHEYNRIRAFMRDIGAKYFQPEPTIRRTALELVDGIPRMQHSVLLYEDRAQADVVAAEYLSRGLAEHESCIYLTRENPKIVEQRLSSIVGNIGEGIRENRLRIYPGYQRSREKVESLNVAKKLVQNSTVGMKPPYRIFGNFAQLVAQPSGPQSVLSVEELFHHDFESFGITLLCWHDLSRMPRPMLRRFVESLVRQHHYVVYVSEPSKAFGFDSLLLRKKE